MVSALLVLETACASAPASNIPAYQPPPQVTVPAKDRPGLVLMPLRTSGDVPHAQKETFETSLSEELRKYYTVYAGKRVAAKVEEVFARRSEEAKEGQQCDDTQCLRDVANEFQSEYVAVSNVSRQPDGGYLLALNIQDIIDDKLVYSKSTPCKGCDQYEIVDKLKTLAEGSGVYGAVAAAPYAVPPPPAPVEEESSWWKWALGILLVGGVAAAAGGASSSSSSSSGGGSSGSSTGSINVSW